MQQFGDFQARRAQIRFKAARTRRTSRATSTPSMARAWRCRTVIAVLETYQQADGSVRVPEGAAAPYGRRAGDHRDGKDRRLSKDRIRSVGVRRSAWGYAGGVARRLRGAR